ncbi:TPA: ATP-binding protein [Acinetobacter baumannii]|nr:ATP-binding protein [Acinetobacter baumannii]
MSILIDCISILTDIQKKLMLLKDISENFNCDIEIKTEIERHLKFINDLNSELQCRGDKIPPHYIQNSIDNIRIYNDNIPAFLESDKNQTSPHITEHIKTIINTSFSTENIHGVLVDMFNRIEFVFSFFKELNYLSDNMVLLGANGSGKSSLASYLKSSLGINSLIISAQKFLLIPSFNSLQNPINTRSTLTSQQNMNNNMKWSFSADDHIISLAPLTNMSNHFKVLLSNLLAEKSKEEHEFYEEHRKNPQAVQKGSNLDKVISIWNSIFQHRTIFCDHLTLGVMTKDTQERYEANFMSDGEKVALYYISEILQAPQDALIIIDEPEMYLHKTVLCRLWDTLELERSDCKFQYLTHDIDFATSRTNAEKYWIRSYKNPDQWAIEKLNNNNGLPENLLLELIGSRKNILFCEGEIGKNDDEIYRILFPNFTVKPVGSCTNVINFTRAFNKIRDLTTQAFGLIDSDHSPSERSAKLAKDKIYSLQVAEVENLLLDEDLLKMVIEQLKLDNKDEIINKIKNSVISSLQRNLEIQTANYISFQINFYFEEANLRKGNKKDEVKANFSDFISKINIDEIYDERYAQLEQILSQKNYLAILKIYNSKGLSKETHNILDIKSYKDFAIRILKSSSEAKESLKKHFPEPLLVEGC